MWSPTRRPARCASALGLAASTATLLVTGCGVLGGAHHAPPATRAGATGAPSARVRPRIAKGFGGSFVRYTVPRAATRYQVWALDGWIRLPGYLSWLGFRVDQAGHGHPTEVRDALRMWRKQHVHPEKFTVDGGTAYRADDRVPGQGNRERYYVARKGAVTLYMSIPAPRGQRVSPARRAQADRLFSSIRFDESVLNGQNAGRAPQPATPFTFEKPPSMRQPQVLHSHAFDIDYTVGGQVVTVALEFYPEKKARRLYAERKRAISGGLTTHHDVKKRTLTAGGIGRQIDEGIETALLEKSDGAIFYLLRRSGTLVKIITRSDDAAVSQPTIDTVNGVVGTMRFI